MERARTVRAVKTAVEAATGTPRPSGMAAVGGMVGGRGVGCPRGGAWLGVRSARSRERPR